MRHPSNLVVFLLFGIFSFSTMVSAGPDFKEGQWEYEVKIEIPGMQAKMPAMKHSQCVTQKELVPKTPQGGGECKNVSQNVSGNTVTWTAKCKQGDNTMDGQGTATYLGDRMEATIKNSLTLPGQGPITSVTHVTGRHAGPCKK